MDCKGFREILDLYVDHELSAEATAAAGLHLNECAACRSARDELLRLRQALQAAVSKHQPPASLSERVHRISSPPSRRAAVASLIVVILALASFGALERVSGVRASVAGAMEQIAFHLDRPHMVVVEGTIVCRERALRALYGSGEGREVEGYHGALMTSNGKLWNFLESKSAHVLIYDESLAGKRVQIRAKLYRRGDCLEVESYKLL